jgi:branched-subunit amino acid transport protein
MPIDLLQPDEWYILGAIALLVLCTLLTRTTFHLFGHRIPLGDGVRRALRYAPAAALTAIVVPALLPWSAQGFTATIDEKIVAALVAIWIYQRTRNNLAMIVGGMAVFWVIRAIFG